MRIIIDIDPEPLVRGRRNAERLQVRAGGKGKGVGVKLEIPVSAHVSVYTPYAQDALLNSIDVSLVAHITPDGVRFDLTRLGLMVDAAITLQLVELGIFDKDATNVTNTEAKGTNENTVDH